MGAKKTAALIIGSVLAVQANGWGSTFNWNDPTGMTPPVDQNFNNPLNWVGGLPGAGDDAQFNYGSGSQRNLGTISLASNTSVGGLFVISNTNMTLDLAGKTLTLGEDGGGTNTNSSSFTITNSGKAGVFDASNQSPLQSVDGAVLTVTGVNTTVLGYNMDIGVATGPSDETALVNVSSGASLVIGSPSFGSSQNLNIGASADGILNVTSGGSVRLGTGYGSQITIGGAGTPVTGVLNISGTGSTVSTGGGSDALAIGGIGNGTVNVGVGGTLNANNTYFGYLGGIGKLNISGGTVNTQYLGANYYGAANGSGITFTGGTLNVITELDPNGNYTSNPNADLTIGDGTQSALLNLETGSSALLGAVVISPNATLSLNGRSFSANSLSVLGTLNWNGGSISLNSDLTVTSAGPLGATLALQGSKSLYLSPSTTLTVAGDGTVTVGVGGGLNAGIIALANGSSLSVSDGGSINCYQSMTIAPNATFTYGGGIFSDRNGSISTAQMNNSAIALNSSARSLYLGNFDVSPNTSVSVSGGGYLSAASLAVAANAAVTIGSGGNLYATGIALANGSALSLSDGGVLQSSQPFNIATGATFTYTGGDLQISTGSISTADLNNPAIALNSPSRAIYSAQFNISANNSVSVSRGGTLSVGALSLDPTAALTFGPGGGSISVSTGDVDLGPSTTAGRTLIQPATGTFDLTGLYSSILLPSSNTSVSSPVVIGNGFLTVNSLNLLPGGSVAFNTGAGRLTLSGGTLVADGGGAGTFQTTGLPANARVTTTNLSVTGGAVTIGTGQDLIATNNTTVANGSSLVLNGGKLSLFSSYASSFNRLTESQNGGTQTFYQPVFGTTGSFAGSLNFSAGTLNLSTNITNSTFNQFIGQPTLPVGSSLNADDWDATSAFTVGGLLNLASVNAGSLDVPGTLTSEFLNNPSVTVENKGQVSVYQAILPGTTVTVNSGGTLFAEWNFGNIVAKPGSSVTVVNTIIVVPPTQDIIGQNVILAANATLLPGLKASGNITVAHGYTLSGGGNPGYDVQQQLTVDGTLAPTADPAVFVVQGNYIQDADGTMTMTVDGGATPGTDFDQLKVIPLNSTYPGEASLAGSLVLNTGDGYLGKLGDSFELIEASGISGSLSLNASGAALANPTADKWALTYDYADGGVYADVVTISSPDSIGVGVATVPEPASLTAAVLLAAPLLRRRRAP